MDEPCRDAPEGRATGMPPLARLKLGAGRRELQLVDLASNRAFGHAKQPSNLGYAQTPYAIAAATLRRDRRATGHRQGGDVARFVCSDRRVASPSGRTQRRPLV